MKLQPESKKELLRIACGVSLCTAVMWVVFAALHLVGWVVFDYRVLLGGIIGALVAIGNFAGICFVVQKVIDEPDEKKRKAQLQISYNTRMLLQALWIIIAIAAPCFQAFAGVLPLLFPRVTIYYLQITGKYKPLTPPQEPVDIAVEDDPAPAKASAVQPRDEGGEQEYMELNGAKILYTIHTNIPLLGDFKITQTLVTTWIVMALLSGFAIWLGHDLKLENVSKRQAAAEFIVTRLEQFVHDNMGFHFDQYIPLIGAIFALSIGCNLISVVGLWSPTADLNTEAAWAIVVFVLIMYYKIKTNGILAYIKGLLDPIFIMAPINVLSEISTPVSMAFRHFGNILSGTVISTLLYWALASLRHVIFGWLPGFLSQIQLFQIGIPAFTGLYFDWFGGCIQAFIFCTLTAIFIKRAAGED